MKIVKNDGFTATDCEHKIGSVYLDPQGRYWLCGTDAILVCLENGDVAHYSSMDELNKCNGKDVLVSCQLVVD